MTDDLLTLAEQVRAFDDHPLMHDAASHIADLERQLAEARAALEPFARADRAIGDARGPFRFETGTGYREISRDDLRRARAALQHKDQPEEPSALALIDGEDISL